KRRDSLPKMRFTRLRESVNDVDFKFSLCFLKRNKYVNAKTLSMLLIVIITVVSSHEMIRRFSVWAERPKGRMPMMDVRERPSITSWLHLLPLPLSSLLAASGIIARRGELLVPLAVMMVLYAPLLFQSIYTVKQLHVLDPRLLILFIVGTILVLLHCIFILLAAKNEIEREVEEVFSIGKSMEFSETE
ncbi:hypothetical protein PMAYCL1PPCAC_22124, partial [Pristionchus mayeri]